MHAGGLAAMRVNNEQAACVVESLETLAMHEYVVVTACSWQHELNASHR